MKEEDDSTIRRFGKRLEELATMKQKPPAPSLSWIQFGLTVSVLVGGIAYSNGQVTSKIEGVISELSAIKSRLDRSEGRADAMESRVALVELRLTQGKERHDEHMSQVWTKFGDTGSAITNNYKLANNNKGGIRLLRGRYDEHVFGGGNEAGAVTGDPDR